jgi:DNA polymerase-3 subunit delta
MEVAMSIDIIRDQLKIGRFKGIYVIYGEEDYLKAFYCNRIIKKAVAKDFESFNLQKFDAYNFDLPHIIAAINNMPLMSDYKCVVLKDVDVNEITAADWKELLTALKTLPAECIVIYHFNAVKLEVKKSDRAKALITLAQKNGVVADIGRMSQSDLERALGKIIAKNGCTISDSNLNYFLETCGHDMNTLINEVEKLCAYAMKIPYANKGEILKQHIDELAIKPITSSIYDLAKAIVNGNTEQGLQLLDELFYQNLEPVVILSALSGAFCDLYRAKAAIQQGATQNEIETDFNYKGTEFRIKNAIRDCRNIDMNFLKRSLDLLLEADEKLKSSRTESRIILELLLTQMAQGNRRA